MRRAPCASALSIAQGARRHCAPHGDIELQTRIGIATGRVVIGEIGAGTAAAERSASGETPNLAARLQAQAEPGEIVLADETRKLVGESFVLESLGRLDLKGFAAPVEAWRVLGERTARRASRPSTCKGWSSSSAATARSRCCWSAGRSPATAKARPCCSRARPASASRASARPCAIAWQAKSAATVLLQCSPYFSSSALYPVVQHLERTAGMAPADSPEVRAEKLERLAGALPPASLGCLLRLMGLPDGGRAPARRRLAPGRKGRTRSRR